MYYMLYHDDFSFFFLVHVLLYRCLKAIGHRIVFKYVHMDCTNMDVGLNTWFSSKLLGSNERNTRVRWQHQGRCFPCCFL